MLLHCSNGYNIRVSFRISLRGRGKHDNCRLKEGGDYSHASSYFRDIIVLINLLKLGGSGACSPTKFLTPETVSGGF